MRVDSADCNDYLADVMGPATTVKYFRTWGASVTVLEELLGHDDTLSQADVLAAIDVAADRLGNTRAVCRRSYVHPRLVDDVDMDRLRDAWCAPAEPSISPGVNGRWCACSRTTGRRR